METRDYVDLIKNQLTGYGLLESELDDEAYFKIIDVALKEVSRYYNGTALEEVDGSSCIDLKKYPKISTVTNVYRTNGVGQPSENSEQDPVYMTQLQMFNFGSSFYSQNWMSNLGAFTTRQRISNTLSTDLSFKEDKIGKKLYVNLPQGVPAKLAIEYIPFLRDAADVIGEYWEDTLLRLALAHAKIALGRIRTRFKQSSALWTDDGDAILAEGTTELTELRERLRASDDYFLPID